MQQFTIHIPDHKVSFFIELARNLGFIEIEGLPNSPLSVDQIKMVDTEHQKITNDANTLLGWDDDQKMLLED